MSGTGARRPSVGLALTAALTAAMPALTPTSRSRSRRSGSTCIAPGFVDTPLSASLLGDRLEERREQLRATLPIGRVVGPADVAALAVHLMTNTALTGATYDIDGGQQIVPARPAEGAVGDGRVDLDAGTRAGADRAGVARGPPGRGGPCPGPCRRSSGSAPSTGLRIRCAECGGGAATESILMTSPWPESMYAFAPIWSALAQRFRVVAIDLPGFGGSERRDDLLSPRAMGDFLVRFIEESELGDAHLDRAGHRYGRRPVRGGRPPGRPLAASWWAAAGRPSPSSWPGRSRSGSSRPIWTATGRWTRAPSSARRSTRSRATRIPPEIREDYLESYDGRPVRRVDALRAHATPRSSRTWRERLAGDRDPGPDHRRPARPGRPARQRRVPRRAPAQQPPRPIVDAGHFVWEEAAGEYASIVLGLGDGRLPRRGGGAR